MHIIDFLIAAVLAILIALVLMPRHRDSGLGAGLLWLFFLALFLPLIWAGGLWLGPIGPPLGGVSWVGFVAVAFILLMLATVFSAPSGPPRPGSDIIPENAEEEARVATSLSFGLAFWLLLMVGIAALLAHWFTRS